MASSAVESLIRDPYSWSGLAAAFVGLAAGQLVRALVAADLRRREGRIARAICYLGCGFLAAAGLLVLADKAALGRAIALPTMALAWTAACLVLGFLAGSRPLSLGVPLFALVLALLAVLGWCIAGWLPLDAGRVPVARLLPYEVGDSSFRGQFEAAERDSVPILQEIAQGSTEVGLCVETLALEGPLGLGAELIRPILGGPYAKPKGQDAPDSRFYRILGLAGRGPGAKPFVAPPGIAWLDRLLPLPGQEDLLLGSPPETASAVFGLATRTRRTSEGASLAALQPLSFSILPDGTVSVDH